MAEQRSAIHTHDLFSSSGVVSLGGLGCGGGRSDAFLAELRFLCAVAFRFGAVFLTILFRAMLFFAAPAPFFGADFFITDFFLGAAFLWAVFFFGAVAFFAAVLLTLDFFVAVVFPAFAFLLAASVSTFFISPPFIAQIATFKFTTAK